MARVLSYPFRLTPAGDLASVEQDSEAGHAEALAAIVLTNLQERPLVPAFGVNDPTFGELSLSDVTVGIELFGPPVTIESFETNVLAGGIEEVLIGFD